MRHYVRLSQKNYAIDMGIYPLGSCTMKHNPRLNEQVARLPGFSDIHPLQPVSSVQGALELIHELGRWLLEITGLHSVAMSPKAGAHGELCGMMAIKAALSARGEKRSLVHRAGIGARHQSGDRGAARLFGASRVPAREDGTVRAADVREARRRASGRGRGDHADQSRTPAASSSRRWRRSPRRCTRRARYFYCDGANLNAIMGKAKPGELGVDAMHINLHKTFSTPHGGGGPGAGPVVLSEALAPFAPLPFVARDGDGFRLVGACGRRGRRASRSAACTAFHGQMGMFVRAYAWMLSHGSDGMRQASEDAVLNANYIRAGLKDLMSAPLPRPSLRCTRRCSTTAS